MTIRRLAESLTLHHPPKLYAKVDISSICRVPLKARSKLRRVMETYLLLSTASPYNVNTGIDNPFSFSFTNCSFTSARKRIRSCACGLMRVFLPERRDSSPLIPPAILAENPCTSDVSLFIYSFKLPQQILSSPIGYSLCVLPYLIVLFLSNTLFIRSK